MAAPQASSRLEMLQARFQQKQLQEKEQKLLQLYDQQQQRAYQVAQRGSSGSNGSVQGTSTVSHHHQIVTRTSSSGNTTSTSQATKVKQAFNERRQTSVKGIDRSYPLEPIDNKTRKQAISNGIGNARNNGGPVVNRQSITVKRVTRSDVNSNVNDGKPVVSYHEEITRESSSGDVPQIESRKELDVEEFGNENRATHYINGNHPDQVQIREFMDEDTIQRNRMMAKLHLMQYDETMKNRVRNDLESEEFPEELLVEVSDKIPKRTVSKKLSQAEARLERFKSMNAKRNNANKLSNSTTTTASKKRSDQLFPSRTTSRTAKSPSPDTTVTKKLTETRRSVPPSPSKSPDILHKRVTSTKSSDSIAFKKSTKGDVLNETVHQNGLHTQEEVIEKKDQSEVPKKNQTVNIEERSSSKRTDTTDSKRPLAKKPSIEKQQSSSTTAGRPTSSTSTASSGSSTQAHGTSSKGRMATRVRTPNSATSKGCTPLKGVLNQSPPVNLIACKVCGRRFAQDRVTLHEQICAKSVQKKRKQFDTTMYRIKGTDLESFAVKASKKACEKPKKPEIKTNWRRKHEEFINAIRSAKQVQAHLAAGGRLSDLPPPPVSDTSDYIQCPHCGRKFNQAAAERHIPKCEHMLHNKPSSRPPPPRPRR